VEKLRTLEIEERLAKICRTQLGLVAARQAERVGISQSSLDRRLHEGTIRRVFPLVYSVSAMRSTQQQRILAGALFDPDGSICRLSAAAIHGFPLPKRLETLNVEIVRTVDRRARIGGLTVRRTQLELSTDLWLGVSITTPAQTIVDLSSVLSMTELARCLDHAIINRLTDVDAVRTILEMRPQVKSAGVRSLRTLVDERLNNKIRSRSKLEQRVFRWLRQSKLHGFIPNFHVSEADDVEVDFGWPALRVALEVSPFYTHGSERTQARDMERRRQLVMAKWTVVEATDADLVSFDAFQSIAKNLKTLVA
jgi:very-short-patch-repair endonuclease